MIQNLNKQLLQCEAAHIVSQNIKPQQPERVIWRLMMGMLSTTVILLLQSKDRNDGIFCANICWPTKVPRQMEILTRHWNVMKNQGDYI